MKKLSPRGKKYLRVILIVLAFICLSAFLLPTFLFNEDEYKFRQEFYYAYTTLEKVDYVISIRRAGPGQSLTDEEYTQAGKDIEQGIELSLAHITAAQEINSQQMGIPLLPEKYQEYGRLKMETLERYKANTEAFLQKKRNDHLLTNTTMLSYTTHNQLFKMQDSEQWWAAMQQTPERSFLIERQAEELYQNHFISEPLYSYFMSQQAAATYLYDQALVVSETGSWDSFDINGYDDFFDPETDVTKIFTDSNTIGAKITEEQAADLSEIYVLMEKANSYYNENRLAYDSLSRLVSVFSDSYPRMHFESNQRNMLPAQTNPRRVSVVLP